MASAAPVSPLKIVRNSGPARILPGGVAVVCVRIANYYTETVDRSIGSLHGYLSFSVAIEIVNDELRVVSPGTNVSAKIDPPQPGAVQFVCVDIDVASVAID